MKTFLLSVILFATAFCATAQIVTNAPARWPSKVTCYEGKIGSGAFSRSTSLAPEIIYPGNKEEDTVTSPGIEHELRWSFVGRNGAKDVYRFTFKRRTKTGSASPTTTSKEIQFDGKRAVIFEDELHVVVLESPDANDFKTAQRR